MTSFLEPYIYLWTNFVLFDRLFLEPYIYLWTNFVLFEHVFFVRSVESWKFFLLFIALRTTPEKVDQRSSDMWSYAMMLWELATREVPYASLSPMECGMKVMIFIIWIEIFKVFDIKILKIQFVKCKCIEAFSYTNEVLFCCYYFVTES